MSAAVLCVGSSFYEASNKFVFYKNLSEWQFFKGDLKLLQPAKGVIPYDLNTPLFSDYAEKSRFIKLPKGEMMVYNDTGVFDMPDGTILIKNFFYPNQAQHPEMGRRIVETRLLIKRPGVGWLPYQFIWNSEQTEAVFEPTGGNTNIQYLNSEGLAVSIKYHIPNQMECRSCHRTNDVILPIGVAARHINADFDYQSGRQNQLSYWYAQKMMTKPSANPPANGAWHDANASLEQKARAYLDINCGFCHKPEGVANISGLFLHAANNEELSLGIHKKAVAPAMATGGLLYDIEPGHPEQSVLLYRMAATHAGAAMPQVGRTQIHQEGVALISKWIKSMNK